jgi:ribosomal protein S14
MNEQTRVPVTKMDKNLYLATCKMCGNKKEGVGGKTNLCRPCARAWEKRVKKESHMWLTQKHLDWLKVKRIHINPKIAGGTYEYYLPLKGDGRGWYDSRLGIRFNCDYYPERPFMVWHITSGHQTPLKGVLYLNHLMAAYEMISGKVCPLRGKEELQTILEEMASHEISLV